MAALPPTDRTLVTIIKALEDRVRRLEKRSPFTGTRIEPLEAGGARIVGSEIKSAESGKRWELLGTDGETTLKAYTGLDAEASPGGLDIASAEASGGAFSLSLYSPQSEDGSGDPLSRSVLSMQGETDGDGSVISSLAATAQQVTFNALPPPDGGAGGDATFNAQDDGTTGQSAVVGVFGAGSDAPYAAIGSPSTINLDAATGTYVTGDLDVSGGLTAAVITDLLNRVADLEAGSGGGGGEGEDLYLTGTLTVDGSSFFDGDITAPTMRTTYSGYNTTTLTTTSGGGVDHTSGPTLTFTVPASGAVIIRGAATIRSSSSAQQAQLLYRIAEGTSVSGSTITAYTPALYVGTTQDFTGGCRELVLEGLTPGSQHTAFFRLRATGGATATFSMGTITVQPNF